MVLTTRDQIAAALSSDMADRANFSKPSITIAQGASTRPYSAWTLGGLPVAGAAPTAAALCTSALVGSLPFTAATAPQVNYIAQTTVANTTTGIMTSVEIWDRLVHMGGLSFIATTAQTAGVDLSTLAVPAARLGAANYSDVQWFLEVYSASGATASTATINVTYSDGSTGDLSAYTLPVTVTIYSMLALTPLIPTAKQGLYIRGVNSITLSASTGTQGNFGFTALRPRTVCSGVYLIQSTFDWAQTGLPDIPANSCLQLLLSGIGTTTGVVQGNVKIIRA